jgi:hypothetical protein
MHPEIARTLARQHDDEVTRHAERQRAVTAARESRHHAPRGRIPRYRVHWSRTSLSAAGLPGRRERSWVIVISATRGL